MKIKLLAFLFFLTPLLPFKLLAQGYKIKTIVIDPGHGGKKPGASGSFSTEKAIALKVALKLGAKIKHELPDVKVIFTRTKDVDVDLYKRAEIANDENADLFISIHCNSMPPGNKHIKGAETLVAGSHRLKEQDAAIRENADIKLEKNYKSKYDGYDPNNPGTFILLSLLKNTFRDKSIKFAKLIQTSYISRDKRSSRGVKEQGVLVLQRCGMPAVLTEVGFISNKEEEKYINSLKGQNEIAESILAAIKNYKKSVEVK